MKKLIIASVLLASLNAFASVDPLDVIGDRCAPGDVIYYGQNLKHTKEVLVCQWGNKVFYSFGVVGKKPEMVLTSNNVDTTVAISDGNAWSTDYVYVPNGNVMYRVGHTGDFIQGTELEAIHVYSDVQEEPVAEIVLDPATVVNGIRNNFVSAQ